MELRQAKAKHIDAVRDLVADCVGDLILQEIDQWDKDYPSEDQIRRDIQEGTLYVVEEGGEITATVVLSETQEPEYLSVNWKCPEPAIVVHRLCVRPRESGRGIGTSMLVLSERWARSRNYGSLRLDVYSGNPKAVRLYARLGYSTAGHVTFRGRIRPFICMEKSIEELPQIKPVDLPT